VCEKNLSLKLHNHQKKPHPSFPPTAATAKNSPNSNYRQGELPSTVFLPKTEPPNPIIAIWANVRNFSIFIGLIIGLSKLDLGPRKGHRISQRPNTANENFLRVAIFFAFNSEIWKFKK
jgi:hypothetical protein